MSDIEKTANAKPVHKIRRAGMEVAIWSNAGDKGSWYGVTVNRRYKQGEEWKDGGSFGADDLLPLEDARRGRHLDRRPAAAGEAERRLIALQCCGGVGDRGGGSAEKHP